MAGQDFDGESAPLSRVHGLLTLVEGSAFALSTPSGDMDPRFSDGLFFLDTRMLSKWILEVDGECPEPLGVATDDPFSAVMVGRTRTGGADGTLTVLRRRFVGNGMRETIELRNHGTASRRVEVGLDIGTDLADVFEVKEGRVGPDTSAAAEVVDGRLTLSAGGAAGVEIGFDVTPSRWEEPSKPIWSVSLVPGGRWALCIEVAILLDHRRVEVRNPCGQPVEHAIQLQRLSEWRSDTAAIATDYPPLRNAVERAVDDLGALRIFDPAHPERPVVAAGAPWFMTLFGRDSLLASWMALIVEPALAQGVLETLASLQGAEENPETDEQPGRILHEVRFDRARSMSLGDGHIYYGTADATPLFVMLLGELRRWGLADAAVRRLLPHADRALEWIRDYGDVDGDGYVEYRRASPSGLLNQGWKDSHDGVRFADGTIAQPPIALCEVQAYTYAAYRARARFAAEEGDEGLARRWARRAAELKSAFNEDFWLEAEGRFAFGLDADKRPIDGLVSNVGHCLWAGIVDQERAAAVAADLLSPRLFTGFGIRTLATTMAAYDPLSYHNGSVWPHDTALAAAGLMRYGFVEEAQQIVLGLLGAAERFGGRLPELFAGLDRSDVSSPVDYPTSCSPQAWAAAAPLLCLRTLLRFDPAISENKVFVAPCLPDEIGHVRVEGIPIAGSQVTATVEHGAVTIDGLPPTVQIVPRARPVAPALPGPSPA